ncbi:MAG TPA: hypothetical protein VE620_10520 [Myxococcales bacterium]|nr:hypothetical protein [Myxococcales bacterium]
MRIRLFHEEKAMADEVQRLRIDLARMRPGNGRRYGAPIRGRIARVATKMRDDGVSWAAVGDAFGIPMETVRRICIEHQDHKPGFVPVEVAPQVERPGIVLVAPGGHRVEGLDLETLVTLLARLA